MITAIFTYCKCCLKSIEECPNNPPPELTFEREVKLKDVTDNDHRRHNQLDMGA